MAKKLYEESHIIAIAEAIKVKSGDTSQMKVSEMAGRILAIQGVGDIEIPDISEKVHKESIMLGGASNNAITFDSGTKVTTVSPNNTLDTYSWYNYIFKISNVAKDDVIHIDFSGLSNAYVFAIPYIVDSANKLLSALGKNYIADNGSSLLSGNLDHTLTWNTDDPNRAYQISGNAYFTAPASGDMYVLIGRTPTTSSGTKMTIKNITDYVSVYAN